MMINIPKEKIVNLTEKDIETLQDWINRPELVMNIVDLIFFGKESQQGKPS